MCFGPQDFITDDMRNTNLAFEDNQQAEFSGSTCLEVEMFQQSFLSGNSKITSEICFRIPFILVLMTIMLQQ